MSDLDKQKRSWMEIHFRKFLISNFVLFVLILGGKSIKEI